MLAWIKKNWKWIVFPVGILLVLFSLRSKQQVRSYPSPPTSDALLKVREEDLEISAQVSEAEKKHATEIRKIEEHHTEVVQSFTEEQRATYESLKAGGPDAVTAWLLKVGKGDTK